MGGRLTVLLAAALMAGCGSDEPPERDRADTGAEDAATAVVRDLRAGETDAVCERLTPKARRALERLARARGQNGCRRAALSGLQPIASDREELEATASEEGGAVLVKVSGVPRPVPVRRSGDTWQVDVLGHTEVRERVAFETACSRLNRRSWRFPLPPTEPAAYARFADRAARMIGGTRKELHRIELAPGPVRTQLPDLLRNLRRTERGLRGLARDVRGGTAIVRAARKARKALRELARGGRTGTIFDTMDCGPNPLTLPATVTRWRPKAARACRSARRRVKRAGTPDTPAELEATATIYKDLERQLRRAPAPRPLRSLARATATAVGDIGDELRSGLAAARSGTLDSPEAFEERVGAISIRAGGGLARLELTPCYGI